MSFVSVQNNAQSRLNENLQFLNFITTQEPTDPQDATPLEVNVMKGLFYVHLYASFEKTINELIEQTIILIDSKAIKVRHFNESFHTVALVDKLKSFKNCSHKSFFSKAHEILYETSAVNVVTLSETTFSNSLQNVWFETIVEISKCFGISAIPITPRIRTTINELVEKRNAVAHGREKASDVGSRFRTNILRMKMNEISNFIYSLIALYDNYYTRKNYLKTGSKRLYP